jgi:hypothetical protein
MHAQSTKKPHKQVIQNHNCVNYRLPQKVTQLINKSHPFIGHEELLPWSQKPTTGSYPGIVESVLTFTLNQCKI